VRESASKDNIMKRSIISTLAFTLSAVALGCGSPAGTQPHAMSASEHEAAAQQEEQQGQAHGEQFDPAATASEERCGPARARGSVCWTAATNPTAGHAEDAGQHRDVAAKHRAASEALRSAEASVCSGISEEDRDVSPFMHGSDIRSVSPLQEEVKTGKVTSNRVAGAEVVFQAVPGMTAEWLQRVVDCHLARNAAIGHEAAVAEMPYCPLTLRGAQARVRSVGDGFAVAIRADDAEVSKEILKRAESLPPAAAPQ
jgi:hypothetical protein